MQPSINVIEVKKIQDNLKISAEIMLNLLMELKTTSPHAFERLNEELSKRTDLNAFDLASLSAELWDIYN